jgi:glycosyltransferase involved in cell wall biosynthesis
LAENNGPLIYQNGNDILRVVFLSRISPKKNLDFALQVLQQVEIPVEFNIYGMISDEAHWQHCKKLMAELPQQVKVNYHGGVEHGAVAQVLAKHDLFFLPTRGENFGHAIFEALLAGVPALISDQTPWQDFDQERVGWVRSLDSILAFKKVIESMALTDSAERIAQRDKARRYAQKIAQCRGVQEQNIALFRNLAMGDCK